MATNNIYTVIRILQLIKLMLQQSHWVIVFNVKTNVHKTKECLATKKINNLQKSRKPDFISRLPNTNLVFVKFQ